MKASNLPVELRTHCDRLGAWHEDRFIGFADVRGSDLIITASVKQVDIRAFGVAQCQAAKVASLLHQPPPRED